MRYRFLTLVLAAGVLASPAQAQQARSTRFGATAALQLPGQAYVEEADAFFDIDMGFGVGGFVDTRLGEKLLGGGYLDLLQVNAYDESATLVDAGIALKAVLGGGNGRATWRPGIGVGYGILSAVGGGDATHYLTLHGGVEMLLPSNWLAEVSIHGAPSGGNSDVTVSYGPMVMLRFGRVF